MQQKQFVSLCENWLKNPRSPLSKKLLPAIEQYRLKTGEKLPVIWVETSDSGDNNISFLNTSSPDAGRVFRKIIDLLYSNTFMAAQGPDAIRLLQYAARQYQGQFTLVVEGAIPIKDNGVYNIIFKTRDHSYTALEMVKWLGSLAKYVVALGTCASFGGPTAARPNITESKGVRDILDREVINVSGCPINPDWFVGTLAHLLMFGRPELDDLGRPTLFYGFTVHRHCQRRSYFDRQEFAQELGDKECMFSLGCMGPRTGADCPYRQWVEGANWPVRANTPCIGCTNKDFPDGSTPFFTPLPEKNPEQNQNLSGPKKEVSR